MQNVVRLHSGQSANGDDLIFTPGEWQNDQAPSAANARIAPERLARRMIAARAARRTFFSPDLFADPAWDILLELYVLRYEQQRISVSSLCIAAAVPPTTALRWIDKLHSENMIQRIRDPLDGRRVWVEISERAFETMDDYFVSLSDNGIPI